VREFGFPKSVGRGSYFFPAARLPQGDHTLSQGEEGAIGEQERRDVNSFPRDRSQPGKRLFGRTQGAKRKEAPVKFYLGFRSRSRHLLQNPGKFSQSPGKSPFRFHYVQDLAAGVASGDVFLQVVQVRPSEAEGGREGGLDSQAQGSGAKGRPAQGERHYSAGGVFDREEGGRLGPLQQKGLGAGSSQAGGGQAGVGAPPCQQEVLPATKEEGKDVGQGEEKVGEEEGEEQIPELS